MPLSCNLGTLTSSNPLGHSGPVMGRLYLFICIKLLEISSVAFEVINVFLIRYSLLLKLLIRYRGTGPEEYNKGSSKRVALVPCSAVYP